MLLSTTASWMQLPAMASTPVFYLHMYVGDMCIINNTMQTASQMNYLT